MNEQSSRAEQVLIARFRSLDAVPLGTEPAGARERLRAEGARRHWSGQAFLRTLASAAAIAAVVMTGVFLGRGIVELRSNTAASRDLSVLRALTLPEGLSALHVQLSPNGKFLAFIEPTFSRVQLLEIEMRAGTVNLRSRAELAGSIVDMRWREDSRGILVKVAQDRVRDQTVELYEVLPSGPTTRIASEIAKDAAVAAAPGSDAIAVASGCCPGELRVFRAGSQTSVARASGITLLGWNSQGELLYAADGSVHFWTPAGLSSVAIPERPAAIGLLSWSPTRGSLAIGAGERGAEKQFQLTGRQLTAISGAVPTGLWTRDDTAVLLDERTLLVLDARTGDRRAVATLSENPRVLWGVAGSSLLWSSQDSADLRLLDLDSGRERIIPSVAPITAAMVATTSSRFLVLPARGPAQLGEP